MHTIHPWHPYAFPRAKADAPTAPTHEVHADTLRACLYEIDPLVHSVCEHIVRNILLPSYPD